MLRYAIISYFRLTASQIGRM